ncbi:UNVERIFIED_CONTAM: hypothetical protein Sindi_1660800 [Sesamum indicum]
MGQPLLGTSCGFARGSPQRLLSGEFLLLLLEGYLILVWGLDEQRLISSSALVQPPATTSWVAPSKTGKSSPDMVLEEVLRLGGSANGSITLGDSSGSEKAGVDPSTSAREAPATTCRG